MAAIPSEDRARLKRTKSEQAINLAVKNRWEEAVQVNREILELFPNEVDANNRLGKALMELGRVAEAREAYRHALKADPANGIATKNLQRLEKMGEGTAVATPPKAVDPRLYIEESGKTTVTHLTDVRKSDAVSKLTAGDQLQLEVRGNRILVQDRSGQEIGRLEPKLEHQLISLLQMGNRYAVFVTAAQEQSVSVIVRETYRSPQMGTRPSFRPSAALEGGPRAYARPGLLREDVEDEEEDEEFPEEEEEAEAPAADAEAGETTPLGTIAEDEEDEDSEAEE